MPYVLALDEGTTSARAILFDVEGKIVAVAQHEITQSYPQSGWVEHDPLEIWSAQIGTVSEVIARAQIRPSDVAAIGITNQRETTVVWNRQTGQPIYPAIVWQDRRTAPVCETLRQRGLADIVREKTGLVIDSYFSGTKIAWILDHVPGARAAAERGELAFGTIDTWLLWKLTDGKLHVTDVTNASRTMLYDITRGCWDDQLLAELQIPRSMLPEVKPSSLVYGEVAPHLPLAGVPIGGVAGDQQAALFGQMCVRPGMAKNTYGTGCFLLRSTGTAALMSQHKMLTTLAAQTGESLEYALEGSVFIGGAIVQWLRDGLKLIRSSSEVESLAQTERDNGGLYLVPALAGLGAPHWDPHARGLMIGISRGTSAGHIARAALESIAFQVADLLDAMNADAREPIAELRVDGGGSANNLLLQFQADILGVRVVRPAVIETTALGAAYLAGLATGFWTSREDIAAQWQVDRAFEPLMSRVHAWEKRQRWADAVERSKRWEEPR